MSSLAKTLGAARARGRAAVGMRMPRRTVRMRLTLLYGGVFLLSGAALLAITNGLVRHGGKDVAVYARSVPGGNVIVGTGRPGEEPIVTLPAPALFSRVVSKGIAERQPKAGRAKVLAPFPPGATIHRVGESYGRALKLGGPAPLLPQALVRRIAEGQVKARQFNTLIKRQHHSELNKLLEQSGIALAIMTVISIVLGWLLAGRVLRPLRTMTLAARRISARNLHERLALAGPDDELKELGETIDGLLARLEAAFEAQRRFVANASHELRTPLAMMRTSLDVATGKRGPLAPELIVLAGKLREGLDQAERLLESFLVLARAQHGALGERHDVSLAALVHGAIAGRREAMAELELDVEARLDEASVSGSETLLARMVGNVVENAVRHNAPGGWVRARTGSAEGRAFVVLESGGERLDADEVRELATPFRRLGAERTGSGRGFGLGLSIVAAIADAHGGRLGLEPLWDGGLRVRIDLPASGRQAAGARDGPGAALDAGSGADLGARAASPGSPASPGPPAAIGGTTAAGGAAAPRALAAGGER